MPTIDNLSIEVTASADRASRVFDRLASNADRLRGAARGAAGGMQDMAQGARDAGTETQRAGTQAGQAQSRFRGVGNATKDAGDKAKKGASGIKTFWESLKRIAFYRFVRSIIREITDAFKTGITNLYHWSDAIDGHFAKSMDRLATSTLYLKNGLGTLVAPIIESVIPGFESLIDIIVEGINYINMFFAALSGKSTYTAAKKVATVWDDSSKKVAGSTKKAADDIKRTILGFDEINKLVKESSSSGGSGSGSKKKATDYSNMFEERKLTGGFVGFSNVIENALQDKLAKIALILSGASFAIGAILALSGANIPLGIGLMAAGIVSGAIALSWNAIPDETYSTLKKIMGLASMASMAIGLILALTGANVPLGVGLIAAGAVGAAASINWSFLETDVYNAMKRIIGIATLGAIAVGLILALTGVNVPLGIGLIAGGFVGTAANIDWKSMETDTYGSLKRIIGIASLGSLGIGLILALTGVNVPLGVALVGAGMAGAAATLNWDFLEKDTYNSVKRIIGIASLGSVAIGMILALTGVNVPLGIGLIAGGFVGAMANLDWKAMETDVYGSLKRIIAIASIGALGIGVLLALTGVNVPLGIALIGGGMAGAAASMNWKALEGDTYSSLKRIMAIASMASVAVGAILALTGVNIPLGITLIAGGAWGATKTLNEGALGAKVERTLNTITATIASAGLVLGIIAMISGNIPLGIGLMMPFVVELASAATEDYGGLINLGKKAIDSIHEGWNMAKEFVMNITVTLFNKLYDTGKSFMQNLLEADSKYDYTSNSFDPIMQPIDAVHGVGWDGTNDPYTWGLPELQESNATVNLDQGWFGTPQEALGIDGLETGVEVHLSRGWEGRTIEYMNLDNLSTTVRVGLSVDRNRSSVSLSGGGGGTWRLMTQALGGIFSNGIWSSIPQFANGTLNAGSIFAAGEAGPELVGHIGGRTEVLNRSQIASAIYSAVQAAMAPASANFAQAAAYMSNRVDDSAIENMAEMVRLGVEQAMERERDILRQQLETLRQINDKDFSANISTSDINKAQTRANRRAGTTIVPVG